MSDFVRTVDLNRRFSLFPIRDESAYAFFKLQEARFWSNGELSFIDDAGDYATLEPRYQRILDIILAFFLPGDGLINNNLIHRFMKDSQSTEEIAFYSFQLAIEVVHQETYGLMFYTIYPEEKIAELQIMVDQSEYFRLKTDFIEKWTQSDRSWPERLLAFACAEGIFFSVLFVFIFWFRSMKKFLTLIHANELISVDETIHRDFGCNRFKHYGSLPQDKAMEIVGEAVSVEMKFVSWILREPIDELNKEDMNQFVGLVADNLLIEAGLETHYNVEKNPFPWVDDLAMVKRTNFFERKGGNYTLSSMKDVLDWKKRAGKKVSPSPQGGGLNFGKQTKKSAFDIDF